MRMKEERKCKTAAEDGGAESCRDEVRRKRTDYIIDIMLKGQTGK